MVTDADIDEIKRMCVLLFLELQEIRRRLEIEPLGQRDSEAYQISVEGYLKQFEGKLRGLSQKYPHYEP